MKRILMILAAVLVASAPALAADYGQGQVPFNMRPNLGGAIDPSGKVQPVHANSDSALIVTESMPLTLQGFYKSAIYNTVGIASSGLDSSAVLDTHAMRIGTIIVEAYPTTVVAAADSAYDARLFVQIRTHYLGGNDSATTVPLYLNGQSQNGIDATKPDTMAVGQIAVGSPTMPWSSEFVVHVNMRTAAQTAATVSPWYLGGAFPRPIGFPLSNLYGREPYSPYTSIRVRNGSKYTMFVSVKLIGSPM